MSHDDIPGKTPPHSLEAERALLGSLLLDPERIAEAHELVQPEDFFVARHGELYRVLLRLVEAGDPVDFVTVDEALRAARQHDSVGGTPYLIELAASVPSSAHLIHYSKLVSETARLRQLIREATEIVTRAFATRPDGARVQELLDESEQRIFSVARDRSGQGAQELGEILTEAFRRIDARSHRQGPTGLTSGYHDLDEKLSGLNAGDLLVVAARPSMGKTALALNMIERTALVAPEFLGRAPTVLFFSLEMGRLQVVERMICSRARVEGYRLRMGRLDADERAYLTDAADELRETRIFIDDTPGLSMMGLRSRARRVRAKHGLDLIMLDYLQLLTFPGSETRQQEISSISRSLKGLARELNIPIVALAQLSRAVELRDPPRPQLADLRESGSIEQDADAVLLLYRPEYYEKLRTEENRGLAELIIAKHRNGPTGTVRLQFFDSTMRFENREIGLAESIAP